MLRSLVFAAFSFITLAPAVSADAETLKERLALADPQAGEKVFRRCKACHTIEENGASKVGPNLWEVVNRAVATVEGFRYSKAMKAHGGAWTPERLDTYLEKPRAAVPRTSMAFAGLPKPNDRANLIAYLNTASTAPLDLGAVDATDDAARPEADSVDIGRLVPGPGAEETYIYCTACHSEMIVIQQGKTRKHWADLFEWMVEEQGMNEIAEPDLSLILDYLAAHYNEDRPNFPVR